MTGTEAHHNAETECDETTRSIPKKINHAMRGVTKRSERRRLVEPDDEEPDGDEEQLVCPMAGQK